MARPRHLHLYTQIGNLLVNVNNYKSKLGTVNSQGCIDWTGPWHRQGYGFFGVVRVSDNKRVMTVAHRIGAMLKYQRELTHDEFVIHTCSNFRCQNPDHLIIGDYAKKAEIMKANGRSNYCGNSPRGPRTPARQLNRVYRYSEEEILWMRSASTTEISQRYNVTKRRAACLRWDMRHRFKWLKGPEQ